MKPRIVFLKNRMNLRGGLERQTLMLLQTFLKKGYETTLLTTGKSPKIEGIRTVSLLPDSKFTYLQLRRFDQACQKWLAQNPHEIIFGMERNAYQTHYRAGSGVHAVYLQNRKLVDSSFKCLSFKFNPLHRHLLKLEKEAFEHEGLRLLFTNSEMVRKEILQNYETQSHKIEVVHNGVEWKKWELPFEHSFKTERKNCFTFLFAGNGYHRKGLLFLLNGLEKIKNENFRLLVCGKEKNHLFFVKRADELGIREKVVFLGSQPEILSLYQQADALVIPSIYDPFANVTIEALAMGLFVVTSKYNGGCEVLKPFSGEMIEHLDSADSFAASLKKALALPKSKATAQIIRNSVKELDFSSQLDKIVSKTLQTYS